MHAHQQAFGKERIEGAHAALVGGGEIIADRRADAAVEAIARHIDENRDEAVEAVAPRQHAHARPFVELQDGEREFVERVLVDLKQLVARIGLQHIHQRLAGMAVLIEPGAADDLIDLAPQIRDRAGRARIGGRGKQTAEAAFADQLAVGIEAFHTDVIHVHTPVHARAQAGLGDDQQARLLEEFTDLRRDGEELVAAAKEPHILRAQKPEPGLEVRLQLVRVDVVARAEQREILAGQPFQELNRLGDVIGRQRRRIFSQIRDGLARPRKHRLPVLHADAHLGEDLLERSDDLGARRRVRQALDVNVDEALACAFALACGFEANEVAGLVALDRNDRMDHERNVEIALVQFGGHRIEQERHVVIDDFEHRHAASSGIGREPHFGRSRIPLAKKRPGMIGHRGEVFGPVALQVLRRGQPEHLGNEFSRNSRLAQRQRGGGRADEPLARAAIVSAQTVLGVHELISACQPLRAFPRDTTRAAPATATVPSNL